MTVKDTRKLVYLKKRQCYIIFEQIMYLFGSVFTSSELQFYARNEILEEVQ